MDQFDEFISKHPKLRELNPTNLPKDLAISTITLVCKLPVKFDVLAIANHLELSNDFINTVTCGNNKEICRTIEQNKIPVDSSANDDNKNAPHEFEHEQTKTIGMKRNFYNQVTIVIKHGEFIKMNIKLFKNGSMQITGCKKIPSVFWVLHNLFNLLRQHVNNSKTAYAEPHIFVGLEHVTDFKIAMINSNFKIGFNIDREKLAGVLTHDGYDYLYDPSRHAGVNIRYVNTVSDDEHQTSIFVFDKGSIIITGAVSYAQLMECYKFINVYLIKNYDKIVRIVIPQSGKKSK